MLTKRRGVERSDTDDKGYIYYFAGGANTCAFDDPASYLDWVEQGLGGISCELRLDKRYKGNALMLSVSGEAKTNDQLSGSYTEMLKGLDLSLATYYAAEKNICNIIVP